MRLAMVIGIVIVGFAGYIAAGPFLTMNSIKVAVETGDSEKLSEDINFPLVRQNLKEQLSAAMATNAREELSDNPFAALAIAFSDKLVEGMLDTFVTPSGIASLISGRNPLIKTDTGPTKGDDSDQQLADLWDKSRFEYDSVDRFSIWINNDVGDEVRVVMRRDGLKWRLTNVFLPEDLMQ